MKSRIRFSFSMRIECPKCSHDFDLVDHDDDGCYTRPIFNNRWDDLKGEDVLCPECETEFKISEVEY